MRLVVVGRRVRTRPCSVPTWRTRMRRSSVTALPSEIGVSEAIPICHGVPLLEERRLDRAEPDVLDEHRQHIVYPRR